MQDKTVRLDCAKNRAVKTMVEPTSHIAHRHDHPHTDEQVSSAAPPQSPYHSETTEEEVEYVEEDDSVVVPWGEAKMAQPFIGALSGQAEDEGVYSEDEAVAGMCPFR